MEFKTIDTFDSAFDVIDEYLPENLENISGDLMTALQHFDDFDGYEYTVINGEIIVISVCSDVIGSSNLKDWFLEVVKYCRDE